MADAVSWRVTPGGRALIDRRRRSRVERNMRAVAHYLVHACGLPPGAPAPSPAAGPGQAAAAAAQRACLQLGGSPGRPRRGVPGWRQGACAARAAPRAARAPPGYKVWVGHPALPYHIPLVTPPAAARRQRRRGRRVPARAGGDAVQADHQRPLGPARDRAGRVCAPARPLQRAPGAACGRRLGQRGRERGLSRDPGGHGRQRHTPQRHTPAARAEGRRARRAAPRCRTWAPGCSASAPRACRAA
jgi:hypothetical protein